MAQYKLKKWYPGLPKDWKVGTIVGQGDRGPWANYSPVNSCIINHYIDRSEVENNPEYWEKFTEWEESVRLEAYGITITTKLGPVQYGIKTLYKYQEDLKKALNKAVGEVNKSYLAEATREMKEKHGRG